MVDIDIEPAMATHDRTDDDKAIKTTDGQNALRNVYDGWLNIAEL